MGGMYVFAAGVSVVSGGRWGCWKRVSHRKCPLICIEASTDVMVRAGISAVSCP